MDWLTSPQPREKGLRIMENSEPSTQTNDQTQNNRKRTSTEQPLSADKELALHRHMANTLPVRADMDSTDLRRKVAELLGWKVWYGFHDRVIRDWASKDGTTVKLPDYLNDLNAIHAAECVAFPDSAGDLLLNDWAYNLYLECRANAEDKDVSLARATAEQRCRAFVATMEAPSVPDTLKSDAASFYPEEDTSTHD